MIALSCGQIEPSWYENRVVRVTDEEERPDDARREVDTDRSEERGVDMRHHVVVYQRVAPLL